MGFEVTLRRLLVGLAVVIMFVVNGYLISKEEIAPSEVSETHIALKTDPLIRIRYTEGSRGQNMKAFGLDDGMQAEASERMRRIEERYRRKLELLLESAPDPNALADALCGQTTQVRQRYGALRFLIEDSRGQRDPIRISRVSGLEWQDWSRIAPIADVYRHVELSDNRQPDATRMALAAILTGKEDQLLNNFAPWGRGLLGQWSWERVVEENPGVRERVIEYLALMHLAVERATADEGICGEGSE